MTQMSQIATRLRLADRAKPRLHGIGPRLGTLERARRAFRARTKMGERGFEPLKAEPAGLQPAPFGHSGTPARLRSVASRVVRLTTFGAAPVRLAAVALLAQLVEHLHGKEGVDGSSPSEGSAKAPEIGAFAFRPTCSASNVR